MLRDPERFFDVRTVRRNIKSGRVTKEQYEEHLQSLDDVGRNIMEPSAGGDDDGFDDRRRPKSAHVVESAPFAGPAGAQQLAQSIPMDD
ncbi:MAG: hypothetical protein KC636_08980, partial [Myxococcales bacterium]|nr:hypothetical protein [Myxococcales bacterium]